MPEPHARPCSSPRPPLRLPALSCRGCALNHICLPAQLPAAELHVLEHAVERNRALPAGAPLAYTGRRMQALYVIRSGSAKRSWLSAEGEETVRGFCLPGEIIGLDGLAERRHACDVVTLEPASYCRIPLARFELLMDVLPGLRREVLRTLSQSLESTSRLATRLVSTSARARIAGFLLDLSRRLERRGIDSREFELSMSRRDIARHLGLTVETVSRVLTAFKHAGWLQVQARRIAIQDAAPLAALVS